MAEPARGPRGLRDTGAERRRPARRRGLYRFTRFWARLLVMVGFIAIGVGLVFAGFALFIEEWRAGVTRTQAAFERLLVAGSLVVSGFLAGSPFIVFGQLLELFLEQRRLLSRILRLLERIGAASEPSPARSERAP